MRYYLDGERRSVPVFEEDYTAQTVYINRYDLELVPSVTTSLFMVCSIVCIDGVLAEVGQNGPASSAVGVH